MSETKDRIRKIYALAMQGVGGEKTAAQEILDKLLEKYSFSLAELDDNAAEDYIFEYHGAEQEKLLKQTVFKVTNNVSYSNMKYTYSGRACRTKLSVTCTAAQKAEIGFLFEFYVRLWEKEKDYFMSAFIAKHEIFGDNPDIKGKERSDDEIEKIHGMMDGLSDEQPLLAIEENKGGVK